jgi:hypothetical protein
MKTIPILYSTPMVQAIIIDTKTQTRRGAGLDKLNKEMPIYNWEFVQMGNSYKNDFEPDENIYAHFKCFSDTWMEVKCPYGMKGDILWVRETFYAFGEWKPDGLSKKTGKTKFTFCDYTHQNFSYHFEDSKPLRVCKDKYDGIGWYKRPSIFMPRAACRLFLKVEKVRVERLQDITAADAIAEGIERWTEERMKSKPTHYKLYYQNCKADQLMSYTSDPVDSYATLWQKINGPESWDLNPWVWVIEFYRTEPSIKNQEPR